MRKNILFAALALSQTVTALNVDNVAGSLRQSVGEDTSVTQLSVTGTINAADFDFISSDLKNLESLDLSAAVIVPYEGDRVLTGRSVYPANELPPFALFGSGLTSVTLPATIVSIGEGALASTALSAVAIPESVKEIGSSAFAGCKSLQEVTIPQNVTKLGNNMFSGCQSLTSVSILSPVDSVGKRMFADCPSLTSASMPSSIALIGEEAFINSKNLKSFSFNGSLNNIADRAFYGSGLEKADLSGCSSLKSVGDFAFAKCMSLASAQISDGLESLGKGVFFDDSSLAAITLPAYTSVIPEFTFKGTVSINPNLAVPQSVTEIGDFALTGWEHVKEFTAPDGLAYIGDNAMEGWTSLETFNAYITNSVPELGQNVWENVSQADAILYVANNDMAAKFGSDPQWGQFNIQMKTVGVDEIIDDSGNGGSTVTFRFDDGDLVIESSGSPIVDTVIYDIDGRRRLAKSSMGECVVIDGTALGQGVLVARVALQDGAVATLKIARR